MKPRVMLALVVAVLVMPLAPVAHAAPPNFPVILADDLGLLDLGCYGGEIAALKLEAPAQARSPTARRSAVCSRSFLNRP